MAAREYVPFLIFMLVIFALPFTLSGCEMGPPTSRSAGDSRAFVTTGTEITVGAAASLTDVLKVIAEDYADRNPSVRVYLNLGASSMIARQIQAGATIDIFLSADTVQMDGLEKAGLLLGSTRADILTNRLAFITSQKQWRAGRDLEEMVTRQDIIIALCDSSVPIGGYARDYLVKAGLYERLRPKAVYLDNARALLAAVDSGAADLAIVFETDAGAARSARILKVVPPREGPRIVYSVAAMKKNGHPEQSRDFLKYLQSPEASRRFKEAGFGVLTPDSQQPTANSR
ncbi:MAG: molybdate ABC transporter substrate-binding protein [Chloroflexi bacterium]|nr:molybdate ABC transporter substrate-binding protein [Chloroflexota bacterium]